MSDFHRPERLTLKAADLAGAPHAGVLVPPQLRLFEYPSYPRVLPNDARGRQALSVYIRSR